MTIIRADRTHYGAVREFYHAVIDAAEGKDVCVGWKKDIYPAPDFLADSITGGNLYLLFKDAQIAASMVLNQEYNEEYRRVQWKVPADDDEVMVIHALGVHPMYTGKGYGKTMVQTAIELAGGSGMKAVRLDVLEGNYPAEHLYTGLGFQYRDTLQMYYEDTGWKNFRLYEHEI